MGMYNDFLDSSFGRLLAYRSREKRKFEFWWTKTLQNKNSRRAADDQGFQTELLKKMESHGKKGPFTGPVILELQYSAKSDKSPAIHSLTKHYLDLLMAPVPGVDAGRSRILLRDDSQVQFLSCTYRANAGEDNLRLRVRRLSDFFEDLNLYGDILDGCLDDGFEWDEQRDQDESDFRDWDSLRRDEAKWVQLRGEESYKSFELLSRRDAQKELLQKRCLPLSSLIALFGSRYHRLRNDHQLKAVISNTSKMLRSAYAHPFVSANFGHRPLQKGDTKAFRDRVQTELKAYKDRFPTPFPLLTSCGVTVFYVPPVKGDKVDLDNLVRKAIIPAVHDILKPPATWAAFWRSLLHATPNDPTVVAAQERYRHVTEFHVVSYEVLCLERLEDDPVNGSVKLLLHDGEPMRTAWSLLDEALSDWEDHVEYR
jgi:hypothetical protein